MPSSFYSALSGMKTHQQWIDVIGNNLANQNTPGYKVSRATFAESFVQTYRQASEPGGGLGGVNPDADRLRRRPRVDRPDVHAGLA
jgi:flagellar hook protein FlgE